MPSDDRRPASRLLGAMVLAMTMTAFGIEGAASLQSQDDDLDVLLDRLTTYLEAYEVALSAVLADERYVQRENRRRRIAGGDVRLVRTERVTESEVLFLRLPGYPEWFGIRDTRKVDGKAVAGTGTSLGDLLKNPGADLLERAAAIVEASASHNLGGRRTINMPTVPLEALGARNQPRYIFKLRGRSRIERAQVRQLEFEEFDEPTLVQSVDGGSLWSRGNAWVEIATGALWRAELIVGPDRPGTFRRLQLESRIRVNFTRDAALDTLVPKELVENFWLPGGTGEGHGRYSNFRKLTLARRLIGP